MSESNIAYIHLYIFLKRNGSVGSDGGAVDGVMTHLGAYVSSQTEREMRLFKFWKAFQVKENK